MTQPIELREGDVWRAKDGSERRVRRVLRVRGLVEWNERKHGPLFLTPSEILHHWIRRTHAELVEGR